MSRNPNLVFLFNVVSLILALVVSVVNECRKVLISAGFKELKERDHWDVKPSDKVTDSKISKI